MSSLPHSSEISLSIDSQTDLSLSRFSSWSIFLISGTAEQMLPGLLAELWTFTPSSVVKGFNSIVKDKGVESEQDQSELGY